jgi:hypothetical protein
MCKISFILFRSKKGSTYDDQRPLLLLLSIIPSRTTEKHLAETGLDLLSDCHVYLLENFFFIGKMWMGGGWL